MWVRVCEWIGGVMSIWTPEFQVKHVDGEESKIKCKKQNEAKWYFCLDKMKSSQI